MAGSTLSAKYSKNGFRFSPKRRGSNSEENVPHERNLALLGLVFSILVIAVKVFYEHHEVLHNLIFERRLISYEVVTETGQVMFANTWETAVRHSNIWLPLVCGCLATYFTWMCVYLDSKEPGVNPPSPLSPQKYRSRSGHTFHLNYVFAVLVGFLVTIYMYFKNMSV
ncbi:ADP-ribosylation factor-like protein 6-interacting protein 6 [Euwallacea fornicatus]|uniref:ADP-ribosylation factor-like protein 6-interacting protein 6 n=1 Tax=Euwallacea fornicatus TaxID=995702 RepID=UPI00338EB692